MIRIRRQKHVNAQTVTCTIECDISEVAYALKHLQRRAPIYFHRKDYYKQGTFDFLGQSFDLNKIAGANRKRKAHIKAIISSWCQKNEITRKRICLLNEDLAELFQTLQKITNFDVSVDKLWELENRIDNELVATIEKE